jgi:hypothetical protein
MGLKAAHERVRVARALRGLPAIRAAFSAGELSFSQVRAITRVATAENEETYVGIARHATGGQLEQLVRGVRRATAKQNDPDSDGRPRLQIRYDDDGDLRLTFRCSATDGVAVLAALEAVRTDLDAEQEPAESSAEDSAETRRADAGAGLLRLCHAYLERRAAEHPARERRDRSKLTAQVDPLSGWARLPDGEVLPPPVAASAGITVPDQTRLRPLTSADLARHEAGRRHREPNQALRDLLGTVDGERCRFPSCTRRRKLHAHHVRWWSEGGATDLANLVLLCSRHHTVVHAGGFQLALHPSTRALTVTTRTGVAVPPRPPLPWRPADELDPHHHVKPDTLPPHAYDRLDLHYAVSVLMQHAA